MKASGKMLLATFAIGALTSSTANAGLQLPWLVSINTASRTASGSPGAARAGVGDQYIGCWTAVTGLEEGVDSTMHAGCWAKDAFGVTVSCNFPDTPITGLPVPPFWIMSRDALLSFSWNASNVCTQVQTWVYSNIRPKAY